jgi:hypothetical protein
MMQYCPLELLLGTTTRSVVAAVLLLTVHIGRLALSYFQEVLHGDNHPAPETAYWLLAVRPDVAEPLSVVALREVHLF